MILELRKANSKGTLIATIKKIDRQLHSLEEGDIVKTNIMKIIKSNKEVDVHGL